jgi:hypothetical protein
MAGRLRHTIHAAVNATDVIETAFALVQADGGGRAGTRCRR